MRILNLTKRKLCWKISQGNPQNPVFPEKFIIRQRYWWKRGENILVRSIYGADKADSGTLKVNGKELGIRISEPYVWDVSEVLEPGENVIEVVVANTLVNRIHDNFSIYLQLPPSGMMGPVVLEKGGEDGEKKGF